MSHSKILSQTVNKTKEEVKLLINPRKYDHGNHVTFLKPSKQELRGESNGGEKRKEKEKELIVQYVGRHYAYLPGSPF